MSEFIFLGTLALLALGAALLKQKREREREREESRRVIKRLEQYVGVTVEAVPYKVEPPRQHLHGECYIESSNALTWGTRNGREVLIEYPDPFNGNKN